MSRCLYTSFYTEDYTEPASRLVASMREHRLDHEVTKVPDAGKWIYNCAYKPKFIHSMLLRHGDRPMVWTDADSVVRANPPLFEGLSPSLETCDAAICEYSWRGLRTETLSGTIWLAPTPGALRLVDIWAALQITMPQEMDQRVLAKAVELARSEGVRVGKLPVEYCFITDLHRVEHPQAVPVFEHFQHSRIRRKKEAGR